MHGNRYFLVQNENDIKHLKNKAEDSGFIAILLKTSGKDPLSNIIHTLWIATGKYEPVAIIVIRTLNPIVRDHLQELFSTKKIIKVFFDSILDCTFLSKVGFTITGKRFDVSISFQLIFAGLLEKKPFLEDLIKRYQIQSNKFRELQKEQGCFGQENFNLTAEKVISLLTLREILIGELQKYELIDTAELEFESGKMVSQLHLNGIGVDSEKLNAILKKYGKEYHKHEEEIQANFSIPTHLNKPQTLLQDLNNLPALKSKGIVLKDTKKISLKPYATTVPAIQSLLDYRQAKVFINAASQVLKSINPDTGRVHPIYDPLGTVTGRFSCRSPALQAMPKTKEFRSCFIAGKGRKLIIADYSQIELRIAAEISGEVDMMEAFKNDVDFHTLTASIISGKHMEDITSSERKAAKAVNFGVLFGMGPKGLCDYAYENYGVELSVEEAKKFQKGFFDKYSNLAHWCQQQAALFPPITRTIEGRIRRWKNEAAVTELLNTPIQGTAADIIKSALWELSGKLTEIDALLVGCIHDEIILEVGEDNADQAAKLLLKAMKDGASWYLTDTPVAVDVKIADHWS